MKIKFKTKESCHIAREIIPAPATLRTGYAEAVELQGVFGTYRVFECEGVACAGLGCGRSVGPVARGEVRTPLQVVGAAGLAVDGNRDGIPGAADGRHLEAF